MINDKRLRIFTSAQKLANSQLNLPHGTKQKRLMNKLKLKTEMLRRNGPVIKPAVESVLRTEGSLWWFILTLLRSPLKVKVISHILWSRAEQMFLLRLWMQWIDRKVKKEVGKTSYGTVRENASGNDVVS